MPLFKPFRLGSLDLPNRVLLAPLTRRRAGPGKVPTALNALYYAQRASAGLIITESTEVDPRSEGSPPTRPGMFNDLHVDGWRLVTDAVHRNGGRIFLQLSHLGRASHPLLLSDGGLPVGPSPIAADGTVFTSLGPQPFIVPRALEIEEIPHYVEQFAAAARRALDAGFDGVEIHGANGYLIDEFLRDGSNHRTDAYGGPVQNRARFLLEVVEAIARHLPSDRIGVRLSPRGWVQGMSDSDPERTFTYVAESLNGYNLAYLHTVDEFVDGRRAENSLTSALRSAFKGPLILSGGFSTHLDAAGHAIAQGEADLIGFGVAFIANPDLPERLRTGAGLNAPDQSTFYGGSERGYTDYPTLPASSGANDAVRLKLAQG